MDFFLAIGMLVILILAGIYWNELVKLFARKKRPR